MIKSQSCLQVVSPPVQAAAAGPSCLRIVFCALYVCMQTCELPGSTGKFPSVSLMFSQSVHPWSGRTWVVGLMVGSGWSHQGLGPHSLTPDQQQWGSRKPGAPQTSPCARWPQAFTRPRKHSLLTLTFLGNRFKTGVKLLLSSRSNSPKIWI